MVKDRSYGKRYRVYNKGYKYIINDTGHVVNNIYKPVGIYYCKLHHVTMVYNNGIYSRLPKLQKKNIMVSFHYFFYYSLHPLYYYFTFIAKKN